MSIDTQKGQIIQPLQARPNRYAWMVVGLLFIVGALNYLDRTMIATMRVSLLNDIPMTDAQFGLLTSAFLWTYGLLSPFAGFIADRFSRSKVIIFSLLVWSFVTWLTSHAETYNQLLVTRILMGVSEAFYIPAAFALIVDYHKGPTQSLATGLHISGTMIGQSLGFIGGWLAESHSWNYAFHILGVIGIIYSAILLFLLKDPTGRVPLYKRVKNEPIKTKEKQNKIKFGAAFIDLFTRKSFVFLFVFWGLMGIVGWMIMGWLPTYYMEQFSLTQSKAGLYATAYLYPASIVGLLLGGFISDRWSKKNRYARILVPMIGLSIAAPFVFIGSYTTVLVIAVICFLVYGLSRMSVDTNLMPILCLTIDARYRSTGYGFLNMFGTIIGGLGIYAAGGLRDSDINLSIVFQIAALCMVVCILLLGLVKRNAQRLAK
jgi:MFS family permease